MRATLRVPASSANLGPGFDILAVALQLHNEAVVERVSQTNLTIDPGAGAPEELADPAVNAVTQAFTHASEILQLPSTGFHFSCTNAIPLGRGLGSSAAARLTGILAASAMHRAPWDTDQILEITASLEGHRDNAAASLHGGLVICAPGAPVQRVDVPDDLRAVLFLPDQLLSTAKARSVVPEAYSRADAIFNAARVGLLVRAMVLKDYAALADAMDDRWHQPQRAALIPWLLPMLDAARSCGAGAALSGAGPSVLALTARDPAPVEKAFVEVATAVGVSGATLVVPLRNFGSRVDLKE